MSFVLKTDGGREGGMGVRVQKTTVRVQKTSTLLFSFLGCFNFWWVRCVGVI